MSVVKIMLKMECRLQKYGLWIEKSFSILGRGFVFQIGRNCISDSESFSHLPERFCHCERERGGGRVLQYFDKKELQEFFTEEVIAAVEKRLKENEQELLKLENEFQSEEEKKDYIIVYSFELGNDIEDEISEEGEIKKASEKYLKKK